MNKTTPEENFKKDINGKITHKLCKGHNKMEEISNFMPSTNVKGGYENKCISIRKEERAKSAAIKQNEIALGKLVINKKRCTKCKELKNISEFSKDSSRGDGFECTCRICKNVYGKIYSAVPENKIKIAEKNKAWRIENAEHVRVCTTIYYQENKEKITDRVLARAKTDVGRYGAYKSSAKERELEFDLTFEQFASFYQKPCVICGEQVDHYGLDRMDNNIGYIMSNVGPCHKECNYAKCDMPFDDFKKQINKIYKNKIIEQRIIHKPAKGGFKISSTGYNPNDRIHSYRAIAKKHNRVFELDIFYFNENWNKPCYYCNDIIDGIGIDRLDPNKGYAKNNTVLSCATCNFIKYTMSVAEFNMFVDKVYNFHFIEQKL